MVPTFTLRWAITRLSGHTNSKKVAFGMKLLCASKQVTFAGGLGHMHLGYGMMVLYSRMGWLIT
jgi:hypothetical protein